VGVVDVQYLKAKAVVFAKLHYKLCVRVEYFQCGLSVAAETIDLLLFKGYAKPEVTLVECSRQDKMPEE
jgi:hypothetical protein